MTRRSIRPACSLRMAGGFETKEAAAARIAKQQASQKKADSLKQQQQQQPAKAAVQQQPLSAQLEELSSRPSPPPPAEEPFKNPVGSRADEILRRAGVEGRREIMERNAKTTEPPKEFVVTMFDIVPMELQAGIEKVLQLGITGCLLFFLASGISIGLEAYAVSTKTPLAPECIVSARKCLLAVRTALYESLTILLMASHSVSLEAHC
eukprot:8892-Heterococcus_DN1.PRE.3